MNAHVLEGGAPPSAMSWRWAAALATVLLLHGAALVLLQQVRASQELDSPAEAMLLDLAPALPPVPPAPAEAAPPPDPAPPSPVVIPEPKPPPGRRQSQLARPRCKLPRPHPPHRPARRRRRPGPASLPLICCAPATTRPMPSGAV